MKYILDCTVLKNVSQNAAYGILQLQVPSECLNAMKPGQFVEVKVDGGENVFLRRPISICKVDYENNSLWLLIRRAGSGTSALLKKKEGDVVNIVAPLGNGFSNPTDKEKVLLIGGGVGVAPMLFLGEKLKESGHEVNYLVGAKTKNDLLLLDEFQSIGNVYISTDDGSKGEKGFIIHNKILDDTSFDRYYCCGPQVMMKAIANIAKKNNISCEVSLENLMACGLGACLCCVEDTVDEGHVCVCKEGPVFNINKLKW